VIDQSALILIMTSHETRRLYPARRPQRHGKRYTPAGQPFVPCVSVDGQ
jgi:hypothetical protein